MRKRRQAIRQRAMTPLLRSKPHGLQALKLRGLQIPADRRKVEDYAILLAKSAGSNDH